MIEMQWVEIAVRLTTAVIEWIADLARSGDDDPGATIRKEILDRRMVIVANREKRDRELRAKHGIAEPGDHEP